MLDNRPSISSSKEIAYRLLELNVIHGDLQCNALHHVHPVLSAGRVQTDRVEALKLKHPAAQNALLVSACSGVALEQKACGKTTPDPDGEGLSEPVRIGPEQGPAKREMIKPKRNPKFLHTNARPTLLSLNRDTHQSRPSGLFIMRLAIVVITKSPC